MTTFGLTKDEISSQPNYPGILKSEKLEKDLLTNGFLIIRNFLPSNTIQHLLQYNKENQPEFFNDAILNTVWHTKDTVYKKKTVALIADLFEENCNRYFKDFRLYGGAFVIKQPGPKAVSSPHFDLGIVDEERFRAFSVWVPLCKVSRENGALMVVPKSHIFQSIFRGPNIPEPTVNIREWLWNVCNIVELNAGDAVVYDHRLIHGSRENKTDTDRIVASCTLTSANAPLVLYYLDAAHDHVGAYEITQDFFMDGDLSRPPDNIQPFKTFPYQNKVLQKEQLPFVRKPRFYDSFLSKLR